MANLDEQFADRIAAVIARENPGRTDIVIGNLKRAFGGNARLAVAFDLDYQQADAAHHVPCILLSQVAGGHVDSNTEAEYGVLKALTGQGICTPAAVALDNEGFITGGAAIIMERVEGIANAVAFLKDSGEKSRPITRQLAAISADLHGFDWSKTGLVGGEHSPLEQIIDWQRQFLQQRRETMPVMAYIFQWLKNNIPKPSRLSLIHGDLRPGNFLYQGDNITALLDWEMAHIGDPAEDIAWIYRDLWGPQAFVNFEDFVALYTERCGCHPGWENLIYYRIFSEIKFATISLSASTSVAMGKSANMRHADRAAKIPACLARCLRYIEEFKRVKNHAAA